MKGTFTNASLALKKAVALLIQYVIVNDIIWTKRIHIGQRGALSELDAW